MINIQVTDLHMVLAFWLCFSRWVAVVFQLPIYENVAVPMVVKVLSSLLLTYAFFPVSQVPVMADLQAVGTDNIIILTIAYSMVGLIIGFLVKSIMQLFYAGGSLISQQIGFAAMKYFDPSAGTQVGPFEKLVHTTLLVIIISSGALLPMFKGVLGSFMAIKFADAARFFQTPDFYLQFFKSIFVSSIMLASPLLFTNFLLYSLMGVIARMVPQMNVLMVSFAVNIGLGLLVFLSISYEFFQVAYEMYIQKLGDWFQFIT